MASERVGGVKITWRGKELSAAVTKKLRPRLKKIGSRMRSHVVKKLREGKTRKDGPSKEGDPPHADTGMLMKSIFWELMDNDRGVRIGTTVEYGKWLEEGTRKMAARPYLRPSLVELSPVIKQIIKGK